MNVKERKLVSIKSRMSRYVMIALLVMAISSATVAILLRDLQVADGVPRAVRSIETPALWILAVLLPVLMALAILRKMRFAFAGVGMTAGLAAIVNGLALNPEISTPQSRIFSLFGVVLSIAVAVFALLSAEPSGRNKSRL